MRSVFDQYEQPENQLTHALASSLAEEPRLLKRFIKEMVGIVPPKVRKLEILEQQVPGEQTINIEEDAERRGLPDAWIHDGANWALLIESKVQATLKQEQLHRHLRRAERCGFTEAYILVIGSRPPRYLTPHVKFLAWTDLYQWLNKCRDLKWARRVMQYMEIWEGKMVSKGYLKDVSVTSFSGIPFGKNEPYSYVKAKLCLKALMDKLRNNKKLNTVYDLDTSRGRGQITGMKGNLVWDYIPFAESKSKSFTKHPHLTFVIRSDWTQVQITLPNSAKAKYWHAVDKDKEMVRQLLLDIHKQLRKGRPRHPSKMKLWVEVLQRHYLHQKDVGIRDGELHFDADCLLENNRIENKVKPSSAWLDALHMILSNRKRANTQLAIVARYDHIDGSIVSKPEFIEETVRALIAMRPFYTRMTGTG